MVRFCVGVALSGIDLVVRVESYCSDKIEGMQIKGAVFSVGCLVKFKGLNRANKKLSAVYLKWMMLRKFESDF